MTREINYADSARRILGAIKEIDVNGGESLQPFMEQFEHIKLREGFVLDAFECGNDLGSNYKFYARRKDASEPYVEPEHLIAKDFFSGLRLRAIQHPEEYENDEF